MNQNHDEVGIKTPEYVSLQFQLAGLGSRSAAFIIDQLILMIVNILIIVLLFFILIGQQDFMLWASMNSVSFAIAIILLFILNWGYFFAFEYFSGGRTIGKKVIGIRVIQENGHSITLLSSFIRNFLRIIDSLPVYYFLGLIMIFFHSKHKRIGDLVAGTIVVHERKTKKNKLTAIEKEIEKRGLTKDDVDIDEWALKSFDTKEWNLIKTYTNRFMQLPYDERNQLTIKVAEIMLPKTGIVMSGKNYQNLEDILLVLYLKLKDEWEYEL
ncbi:RDD family protein [Cytobacillus dafuensis]|uniref:RDD family protein n=1 Tax=Cytobacillus dafuensis TaxID=1742359 RepID=A0A5B8Z3V4_CYTDA|nr:RDD family protein [Cytobacillus dafuensis]QED47790.1 RDD family protein [Cytobacillus dafuensis]